MQAQHKECRSTTPAQVKAQREPSASPAQAQRKPSRSPAQADRKQRTTRARANPVQAQWRTIEQTHRIENPPVKPSGSVLTNFKAIKDNFPTLTGGEVSTVKKCPEYGRRDGVFPEMKSKSAPKKDGRKPMDKSRVCKNLYTLLDGDYTAYNHHNPSIPSGSKSLEPSEALKVQSSKWKKALWN